MAGPGTRLAVERFPGNLSTGLDVLLSTRRPGLTPRPPTEVLIPEPLARWIAVLGAAYLAGGLGFAVVFAWRLAGRLDPAARDGTPGFRLLILPGAALLWPFLLLRLVRRARS